MVLCEETTEIFEGDVLLYGLDESFPRAISETIRVLIADDENMVRTIAQCLAGLPGCEVALAYNGLDALEKCMDWRPHCIVTDLIMPWINGYQVVHCQAHCSWRSLPTLIIMSALTRWEAPFSRLYKDGATTYVDQLSQVEHLLAAIEHVCLLMH